MATATATPMTMTQKIIAIAVTIIVISTVAIPIINEMQQGQISVYQNSTELFACASSGDDITLTVVSAGHVEVNGYEVPTVNSSRLLAVSDNVAIIIGSSSSTFVAVTDPVNGRHNTTEVTITGGVLSYVDTNVTYTVNLEGDFYYPSASGTYGMFYPSSEYNFNKEAVFFTFVNNSFSNAGLSPNTVSVNALYKGTYNDLKFLFASESSFVGGSATITNIDDSGEGYLSTTSNSQVSYVIKNDVGTYTYSGPKAFLAPLEYISIAESNEFAVQLFDVIPILLLLVPLMMAVRMITLRRN